MTVEEFLKKTWDDMTEQGKDALQRADGAQLLRIEGGRSVLLHIAKGLGFEVTEQKNSKPKRGAKGKEAATK